MTEPQPAEPDVVAVHPERTQDPASVRWHVPGPGLPRTMQANGGGELSALVAGGVLVGVDAGLDAITTTLAPGRSWSADGARVRAAVQATVAELRARPPLPPAERDAALRELAELVVRGAGPYAASHGGMIELVGVDDDVVSVRLGGACHGCPAQSFTVHRRLEADLRHGAPWLKEVRVVDRRSDRATTGGSDCAADEPATRRPLVLFRSRPPDA